MRFCLSVAVFVSVLASGFPVQAQQQQQQRSSYVYSGNYGSGAPVYNGAQGAASGAGTSLYNSGTNLQLLPMQRMIAGQNAPSYTYRGQNQGTQPYTNYNAGPLSLDPSAIGSLTPEQAQLIREQRNAQANAYQQQYLEQLRQRDLNNPYLLQQQEQMMNGSSQYQGSQFSQLYANAGQKKPQVKRKVIYNELNNPLVEPPRLFNPDR